MASIVPFPVRFELQEAQRVLNLEAEALKKLSQSLDDSFAKAVKILHDTKGRVVITGMGKSGHVARKIAATLSSTGTPALFVHPAEASHGDLGMISSKDSIVALSVSGETSELSDIIEYARRWSLPLIAVTQHSKSTLAEVATITLQLPNIEEACAIGLAPTTSTTMMMALGDALATTLMKYQGFSPENFGDLHPGGKLGQRLKRIRDLMHTGNEIPLASQNVSMKEALLVITSKGFGCVGLVDDNDGSLKGIITDGDLRRHMSSNLLDLPASEVMTTDPMAVEDHVLAQEVLALLNQYRRTNLFVIEMKEGKRMPIGIVHIHDFLRANMN
jgi:arabinose-5-phosphate isomerase